MSEEASVDTAKEVAPAVAAPAAPLSGPPIEGLHLVDALGAPVQYTAQATGIAYYVAGQVKWFFVPHSAVVNVLRLLVITGAKTIAEAAIKRKSGPEAVAALEARFEVLKDSPLTFGDEPVVKPPKLTPAERKATREAEQTEQLVAAIRAAKGAHQPPLTFDESTTRQKLANPEMRKAALKQTEVKYWLEQLAKQTSAAGMPEADLLGTL